jgi:hypothetical protein
VNGTSTCDVARRESDAEETFVVRFGTILIAGALLLPCGIVSAQPPPSGDVTVTSDFFPNRNRTGELRARLFAEEVLNPTPRLLITLSGFAEGLLARRAGQPAPAHTSVRDAILRVMDASLDYKRPRFDLLAGVTRVAWGRLDELQPTDVINPLDASRFFFESRSDARLPVALVRVRGYLSEHASLEGIYVPFFRRGRFDQLDEPTSPFNIEPAFAPDTVACLAIGCPTLLPVVIERHEPSRSFGNAQGGARFNATTGRIDWSLGAYRGFEPFGFGAARPPAPSAAFLPIDIVHPRFTMVGGDFETVRGQWGLRGELAAFVDDNFQGSSLQIVKGSSVDAGFGVDRKAGDYRISATALFHREAYHEVLSSAPAADRSRADVSLILSGDRSFARERYGLRTFGVYNASESSGFLRAIATAKIRDSVTLEGSSGWFVGDGRDSIGRFGDSDFLYVRLKYYF